MGFQLHSAKKKKILLLVFYFPNRNFLFLFFFSTSSGPTFFGLCLFNNRGQPKQNTILDWEFNLVKILGPTNV